MRKAEIEAVGDVASEALAGVGTFVKDMHEGIAGRPFSALGPAAAPVRALHDGISRAVYASVGGGLRLAVRGGAKAAALRAPANGTPVGSDLRSALALGALNGFYGHWLTERESPLALRMTVRRDGIGVRVDERGLADAYPDATSRIVLFAHGLCETDDAWRYVPPRTVREDRRTYGERLQDELSYTPVMLRYNTGLRISANGRELAALLERLVDAWPVPVEEVVLVGHSMGGLVVRSACHYGEADDHRWTDLVRHVFCLGSPHLGADLEKGANAVGHALGLLPETRGLSRVIKSRSVGIKDLRYGSLAEEDWRDRDPDEFLQDRCTEVPFLPSAHYYFVGATLDGPVGALLGDLLVRMPSASGRGTGKGRRIPFEVDNGHELPGLTHFDLLNHPAVYDQLRLWLTRSPARRALPPAALAS